MQTFLLVLDWITSILYSILLGFMAQSYKETGHWFPERFRPDDILDGAASVLAIWILAFAVWWFSKRLLTIQDDPEAKRKAFRNMRISVYVFGGAALLGGMVQRWLF